jgi:beta-mannosidase
LISVFGWEPQDLNEYVEWSQTLQAQMLSLEMKACESRFPLCGGVLLWSGHDTFPLTINFSIIDFEGHPKPVAFALAQVWREAPS